MLEWFILPLGGLFGLLGSAVGEVAGWAWEKVTLGIYTWLASGLALLIEWVWSVLDSTSTPRLTANWFRNDLTAHVGVLALAVTVAMMLASAAQAALAGRPEQITDAVKEGVRAIVSAALTITVLDVLIGVVDEASGFVWRSGRDDLVATLENVVSVAALTGPMSQTFIGPLCLIIGFLGLLGLTVALFMRSALIYVAAALAPLVFATNVLPLFRGTARKLIHLAVALVVSKLAIVIALVVAVQFLAGPGDDPGAANEGAAAVGTLFVGFIIFVIAAVTPVVLYKLMPTVESAVVGSGVAGGWGRSATTAAHTALMVKSLGASAAASAATRSVAGGGGGASGGHAGGPPRGAIAGLTGQQEGANDPADPPDPPDPPDPLDRSGPRHAAKRPRRTRRRPPHHARLDPEGGDR